MFTTPCYIRMNTPELRVGLEKLGYENRNRYEYRGHDICTLPHRPLFAKLDSSSERPEYMTFSIDLDFLECIAPSEGLIDCGTHDALFFALAALRDDSDYMQWFCDYNGGNWTLCTEEVYRGSRELHKASVDEIIKHFNK